MDTADQIAIVVIMGVVGLELTPDDFLRLGRQPRPEVLGTVGQWLLLPMAA